jgi:hypothetical protein
MRLRGVSVRTAILAVLALSLAAQPGKVPPGGIGDGGPAIRAQLNAPSSVALDDNNNLYVYEGLGYAIRKIDLSTGTIITVARTCDPWIQDSPPEGCFGPLGLGGLQIDPTGKLLLPEFLYNRLGLLDPRTLRHSIIAGTGALRSSGDGGPATRAGISVSHCVGSDRKGNIFVCEAYDIRRIDHETGTISTIAGIGTRAHSADDGPALSTQIAMPIAIAVDQDDNVYISEDTMNRIRRIDHVTGIIATIAGSGPVVEGSLGPIDFQPRSLAFDSNGVLVFSVYARVYRLDVKTGTATIVAGTGVKGFSGDGGDATDARIEPDGLAVDRQGNIFFAEYENNRVRRVDAKTHVITTIAGNGLPHRPPQPIY